MKKWLMPVLATAFMAACGAQQEEAANQPAHSVVVVRLPENAAQDDMSQAEVRAFSVDANAFSSAESVANAFGSGDAVTFNTLASDEDASENSSESSRYGHSTESSRYGHSSNYGKYGNSYGNYGSGYGNYYGNYYGNSYGNYGSCNNNSRCDRDCRGHSHCNNRWDYNRSRDCFSTGSNYYYRNKRFSFGGFNFYTYFR